MKKTIYFVLAIAMLFLTSCSNDVSSTLSSGIMEDSNVTAPGFLPIVNKSITLNCAIEASDTVENYETNAFTKYIEDQTGIKLDFEVYDGISMNMQQKIASGEKIPEIIFGGGFDEIARVKHGVNGTGIILEIGDYMDNYGYFFNDIYTKSEMTDIEKQLLSIDGNRYFMPRIVEQVGNNYGMKTWINKVWLDKLGLEIPKTTEQFREVLKAFVTMDPNGNGINDELGICGNVDGWNAQPHRFLINSFISECDISTSKYANVGDDDKLYINFTKNEYKEALLYISNLVKEGLFDKENFTRTGDEMMDIAKKEDNVIGCFTSGSPDWVFSKYKERMLDYVALEPLEGPFGVAYSYYSPQRLVPGAYITKYCKHPLAAFRLLDFMMSKEATIRSRYGVEGIDWVYADEGDVCIFEGIGQKAVIKSTFQYGVKQNSIWESRNPEFRYSDIANGMAWNGDKFDGEKFKADALVNYYNKEPEKYVKQYMFTEEEYEEVARLYDKIIPYAEGEIKAFVLCQKDINVYWQKFQSELKKRGIDRYLELLQSGYNRYENNIW